jgi:hypothetical protein
MQCSYARSYRASLISIRNEWSVPYLQEAEQPSLSRLAEWTMCTCM